MTAGELCPAILYDREEERVICVLEPRLPGAWSLVCRSCWSDMLEGAADREAVRQEWEVDK